MGGAQQEHGGPGHGEGQEPGVWASQEGLQAVPDATTWDPIHLGRGVAAIDRGWILLPVDRHAETQPRAGSVQCHWGVCQGETHDCRASTTGLPWQAFDRGAPMPAGHACGNSGPRQVISHGGQKAGARISWGQGGPSPPYDQPVRWRDPAARWQVEEIWVRRCSNLVQATPTNLGSCTGLGTPHTPQGSRIQFCGVPHVHWWGAWGPQTSWFAPLLVLLEGQLLCLWTCACRWRCRDLLGEGSPDLDFAYTAGSPWNSFGTPGRTSPLLWRDTAGDNVVVEHKEPKIALLKGRRSRRRLWTSWNRCSCRSQPRWRSGDWFGGKLEPCWQQSTSLATHRFLWWTCLWQMWWIPRSSSGSEPCAMRGSLSPLRSFVPLRRSMPSWSPMCSPAPMWKWRLHGDATRNSGGGQRLTLPMLDLYIASWTTPMRPFGHLVWIQTCQLGLLRWVRLPTALTPRQGLPCWWNILTNYAPPSLWRMWTLWWARTPRRRWGAKRSTSFGPRQSVDWFWAPSHHGKSSAKKKEWPLGLYVQALPGLLETGPWGHSTCPNHWTQQGQEGELAAHHGWAPWGIIQPVDQGPDRVLQERGASGAAPWWAVGFGPPCGTSPSLPLQWSGSCGPTIWASILSNRELSNLQYIGRVADKHARRARSSGGATIAWGASSVTCDCPWRCRESDGLSFFIPMFWMCEGFSTADGVVVPLHNDEGHDWQWSFMIFPLGIDPSSARQKVLVRLHCCSLDSLWDGFFFDAAFYCICCCLFLFFQWGWFCFVSWDSWDVVIWGLMWLLPWCFVGLGWFGLAFGLSVYWLKCLTMALLSQFKFPSPFARARGSRGFQDRTLPGRWWASLHVFPSTQRRSTQCRWSGESTLGSLPQSPGGLRGTHWPDTISDPFWTMEAMVFGVGWKSSFFPIGCLRLGTKPLANHGKGHLWKALLHFHAQRIWLGTSWSSNVAISA